MLNGRPLGTPDASLQASSLAAGYLPYRPLAPLGLYLSLAPPRPLQEHVLAVLGPASMAFSNTRIKMSKLQAAQVGRSPWGVNNRGHAWAEPGAARVEPGGCWVWCWVWCGALGSSLSGHIAKGPALSGLSRCSPSLLLCTPPLPQVYAASIMFGYFLRRVDKRFQLAKQVRRPRCGGWQADACSGRHGLAQRPLRLTFLSSGAMGRAMWPPLR